MFAPSVMVMEFAFIYPYTSEFCTEICSVEFAPNVALVALIACVPISSVPPIIFKLSALKNVALSPIRTVPLYCVILPWNSDMSAFKIILPPVGTFSELKI